jgi:hypothetical protein
MYDEMNDETVKSEEATSVLTQFELSCAIARCVRGWAMDVLKYRSGAFTAEFGVPTAVQTVLGFTERYPDTDPIQLRAAISAGLILAGETYVTFAKHTQNAIENQAEAVLSDGGCQIEQKRSAILEAIRLEVNRD